MTIKVKGYTDHLDEMVAHIAGALRGFETEEAAEAGAEGMFSRIRAETVKHLVRRFGSTAVKLTESNAKSPASRKRAEV